MNRKLFASIAAFAVISCGATAMAEDYTPGLDIQPASEENLNGEFGEAYAAAGYQGTFTYIAEEGADVVSIDLFSDFQWYDEESCRIFADNGYSGYTTAFSAYQYQEGYVKTSYGSPVPVRDAELNVYGKEGVYSENGYIYYPMEEVSEGVYQVTLPMPAGEYKYAFRLHTSDEEVTIQARDQSEDANWYATSTYKETPNYWSYVLVGTADDVEGVEKYYYPTVDEDHQGTVYTDEVECITGSMQQLQIYVPYNYDPDASEPYKTIYMNHGATENETAWMTIGNVPTIMDNLIAEGKISDHVIVVAVDNATSFNNSMYGEQEDIVENHISYVLPYIAENYNASTEAEDICMCGFSAGSIATLTMMQEHVDAYSYFGVFSCPGEQLTDITEEQAAAFVENADKLYIAGGTLEKKEASECRETYRKLVEDIGCIDLEFHSFDGAHDFITGRQQFIDFVDFIGWVD